MTHTFLDVVHLLLQPQTDDESEGNPKLAELEAEVERCVRTGVKDTDTALYCAGIVLDTMLERLARFFDGDDTDAVLTVEPVDPAGVDMDPAQDVVEAASSGLQLIPADKAEALVADLLEDTFHDAGLGSKGIFAAATEFEAASIVERAARLIAHTMRQHRLRPSFKEGQPCFVYRFEDEQYLAAHVTRVLGDDMYRVQLDDLATVSMDVDVSQLSTAAGAEDDDDEDAGEGACELCGSESRRLTRHHLIPKLVHNAYRRKGLTRAELAQTTAICRPCHNAVHRAEPHAVLAARYNTVEKLGEHPEIAKWVRFAASKRKSGRWDHAMMVSHQRFSQTKQLLK